jgi:thermospermine synthase
LIQDFYEKVVLPKLNPGGIFITQSGPAGFLSCTEVFTCINATLRSVFPKVVSYTQHMPVFCDVWGWNMALTEPSQSEISPEELDRRIAERIEGGCRFLDGETFKGLCILNKHVRKCLVEEKEIYTSDSKRFIHGKGSAVNGGGGVGVDEPSEVC